MIPLVACEVHSTLIVPGIKDFAEEITSEYPFVKGVKVVLYNPTAFAVHCKLEKYIIPEKMGDLIEILKDYALTDALDAYNAYDGTIGLGHIFLVFHVKERQVYFSYRYALGGYDNPEWELD